MSKEEWAEGQTKAGKTPNPDEKMEVSYRLAVFNDGRDNPFIRIVECYPTDDGAFSDYDDAKRLAELTGLPVDASADR